MTSTKHFIGDGVTINGNDEGRAVVYNFTSFLQKNSQGYKGGIEANTGTIMASYSAINNIGNAISSEYLTGYLKNEKEFDGFVISDYAEIQKTAY